MKNPLTLRNDSSFAVQFSNLVLKTGAILLFTMKIIEVFELHASMPPMRSSEYQVTVPLKFLIIIHNDANDQTINQSKSLPGFRLVVRSLDGINSWLIQTLLRGENDSKQSDEIQANDFSLSRRHLWGSSYFVPPHKYLRNQEQHSFPKLSQSHCTFQTLEGSQ